MTVQSYSSAFYKIRCTEWFQKDLLVYKCSAYARIHFISRSRGDE